MNYERPPEIFDLDRFRGEPQFAPMVRELEEIEIILHAAWHRMKTREAEELASHGDQGRATIAAETQCAAETQDAMIRAAKILAKLPPKKGGQG